MVSYECRNRIPTTNSIDDNYIKGTISVEMVK